MKPFPLKTLVVYVTFDCKHDISLQWELLLVESDQLTQSVTKPKQSSPSIRPLSDVSSVILPAITPVSISVSEKSAFTGVLPQCTTPLQQHDDVMTTPISSPSGVSYFSEDDLADSPLQHHHGNNIHNDYCKNATTVSFAQHYHSWSKQPSLLVTAEVHTPLDKNIASSSSIMTPVVEGAAAPSLMNNLEEKLDSILQDSWNEAELIVPGTPDLQMDSDHATSNILTTTGRTASSSYKETIPSPTIARPKPNRLATGEVKMPFTSKSLKGKGVVTKKKRRSQQLQADSSDSSVSDVIPPASVATAPGLKPWQSNTKKINNHLFTMPTVLQSSDPLVTMTPTTRSSEMVTCTIEGSTSSILATSNNCVMIEEHHTLPLSNSPIDIVIMLSRMAAFCASITMVLSPKLPVNASLSATGMD